MSPAAKPCDSCKTAPSAAFCRADSAFLCLTCDAEIHAAGDLASRHPRFWLCEVCEQAPASVTCRADAAVLCAACDRDIHSANPLSRRHERIPIAPFYDTRPSAEEEAEAASWLLLPNPDGEDSGSPEYKSPEYLFSQVDPYLDLDLMPGEQKPADGVVPVSELGSGHYPGPVVDGFPSREMCIPGSKPFMYNFTSQSISQSVSSSSPDAGVVPDYYPAADASSNAVPVLGLDRKARVLRYREKRKNRKFEKTIRYASRKAYAETRPRIKGRFAKRSELEVEAMIGVVPSF